jgi:hypothetical protein
VNVAGTSFTAAAAGPSTGMHASCVSVSSPARDGAEAWRQSFAIARADLLAIELHQEPAEILLARGDRVLARLALLGEPLLLGLERGNLGVLLADPLRDALALRREIALELLEQLRDRRRELALLLREELIENVASSDELVELDRRRHSRTRGAATCRRRAARRSGITRIPRCPDGGIERAQVVDLSRALAAAGIAGLECVVDLCLQARVDVGAPRIILLRDLDELLVAR